MSASHNRHSFLDVPGFKVGHAQDYSSKTGVTVIVCPPKTVGGVEVRGSAAGTRQIDALNPQHSVPHIHGVMIVGGSAFGLDAAGGAMRFMEERAIGYNVLVTSVPIIPTAVIFDLAFGKTDVRPDQRMGYEACENATDRDLPEGSVGAGTGATVGKFFGVRNAMKGGLGSWSESLPGGVVVGALAVVNAFGDILDQSGSHIIAGARKAATSSEFVDTVKLFREGKQRKAFAVNNTTIGVIATNARLDKESATKVARICHNGLSKSITPVHTTFDGDTIFVLSAGEKECDLNGLCITAESAVRTAIYKAVTQAHGFGELPAYRDI